MPPADHLRSNGSPLSSLHYTIQIFAYNSTHSRILVNDFDFCQVDYVNICAWGLVKYIDFC